MSLDLDLFLIGISHRTSSVEVRERCAIAAGDLERRLRALAQLEGVREDWIVSTCNRTEVLVCAPPEPRLESAVRELVFQHIDADQVYVYRGLQAVIHLFRVAAGLDSMVLGESEILRQVKAATEAAARAECLKGTLHPLLQQAQAVGKRVRTETGLERGTLSVARMAVDIGARAFGSFEDTRVLVVGAGETAALAARHLLDRGRPELAFANRTLERARAMAKEFGATAHGLDELGSLASQADLVLACVDGAPGLLTEEHFPSRTLARRDRPALLLDLSVPRAAAEAVPHLKNLIYYDLDDVAQFVAKNQEQREQALEGTSEILVAEVHKFLSRRTYAALSPVLAAMRMRFESVREEVLDTHAGEASEPRQIELAHELTKRLLDVALNEMKSSVRQARDESELDRAYQRFLENL